MTCIPDQSFRQRTERQTVMTIDRQIIDRYRCQAKSRKKQRKRPPLQHIEIQGTSPKSSRGTLPGSSGCLTPHLSPVSHLSENTLPIAELPLSTAGYTPASSGKMRKASSQAGRPQLLVCGCGWCLLVLWWFAQGCALSNRLFDNVSLSVCHQQDSGNRTPHLDQ